MSADDLKGLLDRSPFEPFRVKLSSGDHYDVRNPHAVALMQSRMFITFPEDRWVLVPYRHVAAIVPLQAA